MLMTGSEIISAYYMGEVEIDPFSVENANSASYDVTLGPFYYKQVQTSIYNPYDEAEVLSSWRLHRAIKIPNPPAGIGEDDYVICIFPKEIILAHTLEFIGSVAREGKSEITTQMHSRSTTVRSGIDVCGSGGFGDHGFCSRWTMEIVNTSSNMTYLVVGRRIAQLSFFRTKVTSRDYASEGKYHDGMNREKIKAEWTPDLMLPRAYRDREVGKPNKHTKLIESLLDSHREV
jgi:dCTP deaminase